MDMWTFSLMSTYPQPQQIGEYFKKEKIQGRLFLGRMADETTLPNAKK